MSRFPRMSFPVEDDISGCSEWCAPLHMVEKAIAGHDVAKYFDVDHFMFMGRLHRDRRPDLNLYKHRHTRLYLNLDAAGHAYRYLAPPPESAGNGQYRPFRDLEAAIDHLRLHEVPWLFGSGFEDAQMGFRYEDRWEHPDVIAWYQRADRRRG